MLKKILNNGIEKINKAIDIEKKVLPAAIITAMLAVLVCGFIHSAGLFVTHERESVTVGFLCSGDESTPYSENFLRVVDAINIQYGSKIKMFVRSNVPHNAADRVLDELADLDCDIIFTNSYEFGEYTKEFAKSHPDIQFCQATCSNANDSPLLDNYHTFMGEIYEGWFISGRIAGAKLNEMIKNGEINEDEAWLGFVGAFQEPETMSDYTAFLLGARRECKSARMRVKYTNSWSDYRAEKETAEHLLNEGCIILSQDTDTCGVAVACENTSLKHHVYHIGYNQDMMTNAPNTTITGARTDWAPYICSAIEAIINNARIEDFVDGHIHGNDAGGGFEHGWVKMLDYNRTIAPSNYEEIVSESIEEFKNGTCMVFFGDYTGVAPYDQSDVCNLKNEYRECRYRSAPSFHYILNDVVIVEN